MAAPGVGNFHFIETSGTNTSMYTFFENI